VCVIFNLDGILVKMVNLYLLVFVSSATGTMLLIGFVCIMMLLMFRMGMMFSKRTSFKDGIKDIELDKLLHREPIQISDSNIFQQISGKRILVTGAAGSIGSEITRQLSKYHPSMVILCDQGESSLYEIQMEMQEQFRDVSIKTHIASVRNIRRMRMLFEMYRPEIVFHAAAYKHVPMMEHDPSEAVLTNVLGTVHVADLSVHYGVEKFVMISTDKAVNPTSVMGASKRIAEMYVQSMNGSDSADATKFMITRFGNVMDSSGSVIPRFRRQIMSGGPVTVTHPEIKRFFMTIPEAVQLVLEAASIGKGGEVFVFDMGEPVRISDLAKKMIGLAGLKEGKDIHIVYIGLRPGEKLFEELLTQKERLRPTHHHKIKIAVSTDEDLELLPMQIKELISIAHRNDKQKLLGKIKDMVPEFLDITTELNDPQR